MQSMPDLPAYDFRFVTEHIPRHILANRHIDLACRRIAVFLVLLAEFFAGIAIMAAHLHFIQEFVIGRIKILVGLGHHHFRIILKPDIVLYRRILFYIASYDGLDSVCFCNQPEGPLFMINLFGFIQLRIYSRPWRLKGWNMR